MATADYRLCDVCDGKVFYDANLNYEQGRASEWAKRQAPFRWAGEEQGKPESDDWLLRLDYLGDWAVICSDCAKTHKTTVVPIESAPAEPKREPLDDDEISRLAWRQRRNDMTRTIRKGQIIAITQSGWSDCCLLDHVRALRDFDPIIEAERFKPKGPRKDYFNDDEEYVAWLIREAIVEPLPVNEVVELHIGDYVCLAPEVRGPAEGA